jgi:HlyD family secretion protein
MSAMDDSARDGVTGRRPSARRNVAVGLQGEALIIELRSAKEALNRRRAGVRPPAVPRRTPSATPDRVMRRSSNSQDRLDQFDHRLLQKPLPVKEAKETDDRAPPEPGGGAKAKIAPTIQFCLQILRAQFKWLLHGTVGAENPGRDFTEHVLRTHDNQLKTSSRVLIVSVAVAGSWATLVPLSGAVVLPGTLVVESSIKKIQHPTGGVVAEIPVQDGMHVNAGTLLARLDETQVRASQQLVADQLDQVRARIARLIGERDGLSEIQLPEQLADRLSDSGVAHLVTSETALFNARAAARQGNKDLYQSNIRQFEEQIDGLNAEIESKSTQLNLIATELTGVQELYAKGLVPLARMTTLQRDSARLEGERAELTATIAGTRAKIGQARLQIAQIDQDFRSQVMKDLREAQDKEAELSERNVAAKDQLNRTDIRAPTSGIVHQLAVHTIGGVVRPGDVIMEIVPDSDDLEIEGHLPPDEIDQVTRGQPAYLRFSTLDRRTMPEVRGTVTYVSAGLSHDEQNRASFYTVKIDLPSGERHHLGDMTLVSGMPVEIFLQTGSRTMLSYLLKPITDQFHRTFNEP